MGFSGTAASTDSLLAPWADSWSAVVTLVLVDGRLIILIGFSVAATGIIVEALLPLLILSSVSPDLDLLLSTLLVIATSAASS